MFFGSKKVIGLDIGTSSIKLAELDVGRNGAQLVSFGFAPTPANSLNGGEITNVEALSMTIQNLVNEVHSRRKFVATGMWGTAVIVKKITIPKMEQKMIADQIKWEAEQYIPFDINNISLAYHMLNQASQPETIDILLVAAQNELVTQYSSAVKGANLGLGVLDVSGFALANIFELNYGSLSGETVALLNIGAGVTNLVVISQGEVIFCRDIPIGGATYTNEIHKEMGVTLTEAEALKVSAVSQGEVPESVNQVLSTTNELVTEEIRNSFDFFAASNIGLQINRCFYSGGSSVVPGLVDHIARATGLTLAPLNPFQTVKANSKNFSETYLQQIAPFSVVALGLALRKVGDS